MPLAPQRRRSSSAADTAVPASSPSPHLVLMYHWCMYELRLGSGTKALGQEVWVMGGSSTAAAMLGMQADREAAQAKAPAAQPLAILQLQCTRVAGVREPTSTLQCMPQTVCASLDHFVDAVLARIVVALHATDKALQSSGRRTRSEGVRTALGRWAAG